MFESINKLGQSLAEHMLRNDLDEYSGRCFLKIYYKTLKQFSKVVKCLFCIGFCGKKIVRSPQKKLCNLMRIALRVSFLSGTTARPLTPSSPTFAMMTRTCRKTRFDTNLSINIVLRKYGFC